MNNLPEAKLNYLYLYRMFHLELYTFPTSVGFCPLLSEITRSKVKMSGMNGKNKQNTMDDEICAAGYYSDQTILVKSGCVVSCEAHYRY